MHYQGKRPLLEKLEDWLFGLGEIKTAILVMIIGSVLGTVTGVVLATILK